jgi:hypothetical protein
MIIFPAWVVVSAHGSEMDWNRAPALAMVSTISSKLRVERASRSSFQTVITSPSRSWSSMRLSSGRSRYAPETFSRKMRVQPAFLSASS